MPRAACATSGTLKRRVEPHPMTRSVLLFALLPGQRDEFIAAFARLAVLGRASHQAGFPARVCSRAGRRPAARRWSRPLGLAEALSGLARQPGARGDRGRARPAAADGPEPRVLEVVDLVGVRGGGMTVVGDSGHGRARGGGARTVARRRESSSTLRGRWSGRAGRARPEEPGADRGRAMAPRRVGSRCARVVTDADAALGIRTRATLPVLRRARVGRRPLPGSGDVARCTCTATSTWCRSSAPDLWGHEPWSAEVADGRMWGRGAGDMKGGSPRT